MAEQNTKEQRNKVMERILKTTEMLTWSECWKKNSRKATQQPYQKVDRNTEQLTHKNGNISFQNYQRVRYEGARGSAR